MKGSVAGNYLDFEAQCIYSNFIIIWNDVLKFEKISRRDESCIISKIKNRLISEKMCYDVTINDTLIIDNKSILENNTLYEIVLKIAMEISEYATNIRNNAKFPQTISKIKSKFKGIDYQEIIDNLRPIEKDLKKIFLAERKRVNKFNKKTEENVFNLKFHPIFKTNWSTTAMLEAELRWNIDEIKGEHHDIISKILSKHNIDDELFLVFLKEVDLFLIKSYLNNKKVQNIFIDLEEKFLKKKSNIQKMNKILCDNFLRNVISFRVKYKMLESCNDTIFDLKNKGYNFSLNETIDITNIKLNSYINYTFIDFNEFSSDEKIMSKIEYCHNNNIKIIVNEVNDDFRAEFCKKNAGDFLKKT